MGPGQIPICPGFLYIYLKYKLPYNKFQYFTYTTL